ncbi:MAG TPA: hypothetical protein VJB12_05180 [Candidatus Nanoarchaeia archaeon]|nr:hypothetical protein [Candidatus Nanoarchaeia archaeon]
MIGKFKDLLKMKEEVDDLKARMDAQGKSFDAFSSEVTKLCDNLQMVRNTQAQLLDEMKGNLGTFSQMQEDLSKEIYDFKLLKGQLQKKMLDKFEEELKSELKVNVEVLRKDLSDYEEMKNSVKEMLKKVELTKQEMGKWLDISTNIKATDFELGKFARQLQQADSEKLELMRKIDSLERLVSKMRRGAPQQMMR